MTPTRLVPTGGVALALLLCACAVPLSTVPVEPSTGVLSPLPSSIRPSAVADPCAAPLAQLSQRSQIFAAGLASLRPTILDPNFDSGEALGQIRRVNASLLLYGELTSVTIPCSGVADLATRITKVTEKAHTAIDVVISGASAKDTRTAGLQLFELLPEVLRIATAAYEVGQALHIDVAAVELPSGASDAVGRLPPLPASAANPTPRPIAVGNGSGWNEAAYNTALAWESRAWTIYSTTPGLWTAAYMIGCHPGATPEQCAAARKEGALVVGPIKQALNNHLSWMQAHPAARCFEDAYAADRKAARGYLAWIADWGPYGDGTPQGRQQIVSLSDADSSANSFLSKVGAYFSNCK